MTQPHEYFRPPAPDQLERWLLRRLVPRLLGFANGRDPASAEWADRQAGNKGTPWERRSWPRSSRDELSHLWHNTRHGLVLLLSGDVPFGGLARAPLSLLARGREVTWILAQRPVLARDGGSIADFAHELRFTLLLLASPRVRQRLRRCARCERFTLGLRARRSARTFCSESCRRRYHAELLTRPDRARRMRDYRQRRR